MTQKNEVYRCEICGNIVEMLHIGAGELVCCGQSMNLVRENSVEAAVEKHVPVINREGNSLKISVGEVEHPMTDEHYIEWIEIITADRVYRKNLNPGEKPFAGFAIEGKILAVREYCNLHGLWIAK